MTTPTRADLERQIAEIQARIARGEYADRPPLAMEWLNKLRNQDGEFEGYGSITHSTLAVMMQDYADECLAIARRHLLPVVPAGAAGTGRDGLVWRSAQEGWIAAIRAKSGFVTFDHTTGATFVMSGAFTHWLPAAKVPGPEVGG